MSRYSAEWYEGLASGSRSSADVVVPLIMGLVAPASVVDVGCGVGAWLATFAEHGVDDYLGVDGDDVEPELLQIPRERFRVHDLTEPLDLGRRFHLALSLEVGEHLPERSAAAFVESLVALAPVVVFSAAIPAQPGEHHVNPQWPGWWADLFGAHGYLAVDCLRRHIWDDRRVEWWYAQNALVYADPATLAARPQLRRERELMGGAPLSLVHPGMHEVLVEWALAERSKRG